MAHSLVVWPQLGEPASFSAVGAPAEVMQSHTVGARGRQPCLWFFGCSFAYLSPIPYPPGLGT